MTEIEKKALALLNERHSPYEYAPDDHPVKVLTRAIEQHEAYKQRIEELEAEVKRLSGIDDVLYYEMPGGIRFPVGKAVRND